MKKITLKIPDDIYKKMKYHLQLSLIMDNYCPDAEVRDILLGAVVYGIEKNVGTVRITEESIGTSTDPILDSDTKE